MELLLTARDKVGVCGSHDEVRRTLMKVIKLPMGGRYVEGRGSRNWVGGKREKKKVAAFLISPPFFPYLLLLLLSLFEFARRSFLHFSIPTTSYTILLLYTCSFPLRKKERGALFLAEVPNFLTSLLAHFFHLPCLFRRNCFESRILYHSSTYRREKWM